MVEIFVFSHFFGHGFVFLACCLRSCVNQDFAVPISSYHPCWPRVRCDPLISATIFPPLIAVKFLFPYRKHSAQVKLVSFFQLNVSSHFSRLCVVVVEVFIDQKVQLYKVIPVCPRGLLFCFPPPQHKIRTADPRYSIRLQNTSPSFSNHWEDRPGNFSPVNWTPGGSIRSHLLLKSLRVLIPLSTGGSIELSTAVKMRHPNSWKRLQKSDEPRSTKTAKPPSPPKLPSSAGRVMVKQGTRSFCLK